MTTAVEEKLPPILRSTRSLQAAMLDGLLNGLVLSAQTGNPISEDTKKFATAVLSHCSKTIKQTILDELPIETELLSVDELIVRVSVVRSLFVTFLTPEELDQYRQTAGFSAEERR